MPRRTALTAFLLAAAIAMGAAPGVRAATCDRQCKIEAANTYLAALVSHDGSEVPFAEDAWRQENGGARVDGGDNIRAALGSPIMYVITGIHDLRWYVEGDQTVAVYFLDTVAPTYIVERFAVNDAGLIEEIDAHFYIDTAGHVVGPESIASNPDERRVALLESNHGPLGPVPAKDGDTGDDDPRPESSCGDVCVRDAVERFLDAMATGAPDGLPLAGAATQTINHRPISDIAANLATSAVNIDAVTARLVQIDGATATALYEIELESGGRHYGAATFATADGAITEIEAVCDGAELCD